METTNKLTKNTKLMQTNYKQTPGVRTGVYNHRVSDFMVQAMDWLIHGGLKCAGLSSAQFQKLSYKGKLPAVLDRLEGTRPSYCINDVQGAN